MSAALSGPAELPLEEPACALCGGRDREPRYETEAFRPYRVVRCRSCRFHYLCPRPTEQALRACYERGDYYEASEGAGYSSYRAQETALRLTFRNALRQLARRGLTGGALLEVGCGYGFLLDEARPHFERRDGTEMAPDAARAAQALADRIHRGGVEAVPGDARYDLILSSQVIEHLHRPLDFLIGQRERLAPGGVLVVATPWMGSPWQRWMGARWPSFKVPEHLLYFERDHLARLLEQAGLEQIEVLPWPHAFPLALVAAKLGIRLPDRLGRLPVWMPGTTLAMLGRLPRSRAAASRTPRESRIRTSGAAPDCGS